MLKKNTFDIVIIGAGAIGCSIAYHLSKQSQNKLKIAVLDRGTIAEEASSGAAGMIAAQVETQEPGPFLQLALTSRDLFPTLTEELHNLSGIDIEYQSSGIAAIAYNPHHQKILMNRISWQKKAKLNTQWLNPEQSIDQFPFLKKPLGTLWAPNDGQVLSSRLTYAFAESAKKCGVVFLEKTPIQTLDFNKHSNKKIESLNQTYFADQFIFATGAWSEQLLGKNVPVFPIKGQLIFFEIPESWRKKFEWTSPIYFGSTPSANPIHCYFVPKKDGNLILGATTEPNTFDKLESQSAIEEMTHYAIQIFPELENFPIKGSWVGLRPGSPDKLPLLGTIQPYQNAWIASGHFRNGIMLSPITGKLMSEWILTGKPSLDLSAFNPNRFNLHV